MKLDFDTVIPGHGAVTNKAGLKTYRNNVEKMKTRGHCPDPLRKNQDDVAKFMTANYGWARRQSAAAMERPWYDEGAEVGQHQAERSFCRTRPSELGRWNALV